MNNLSARDGAPRPNPGSAVELLVFANPKSGSADLEELCTELETRCRAAHCTYKLHPLQLDEDIPALARQAAADGVALVAAAGGDGTVAAVAQGLVGTETPLGVLPLGTGNGLARAMHIPLDMGEAIDLLLGDHVTFPLDILEVDDRHFTMNISAGISVHAMIDTSTANKKRFGILAYVWTILQQLAAYQPRPFRLTLDGRSIQTRAIEVLVSNGAVLEGPLLSLGPRRKFGDHKLDVYVLAPRSWGDYLTAFWGVLRGQLRDHTVLQTYETHSLVRIESLGRPRRIQADGEIIGQTPVEVRLLPNALNVIAPRLSESPSDRAEEAAL
jgi:diacylglycerol kinase family enzyme